ncbi:hypothetical protein TSAR_007552 [Trichomalopsis sarcophagae]|uniref:Uncharacterized protein n=1 Tax=Trichomalopsis sarcophagae TaxID=543379 RepID=A0A232F096_9HYME|nr:hypothetical protein TSAR_007552 [Trichomalopsis sarcophagae]
MRLGLFSGFSEIAAIRGTSIQTTACLRASHTHDSLLDIFTISSFTRFARRSEKNVIAVFDELDPLPELASQV